MNSKKVACFMGELTGSNDRHLLLIFFKQLKLIGNSDAANNQMSKMSHTGFSGGTCPHTIT